MTNYISNNHLADKVDVNKEEDLDILFEELENEEFDQYRELRIQEMKVQAEELQKMKENQHGTYLDVEEKDVLDITTNTTYVIVHFYSDDFKRCKIMDSHLKKLATKHFRARFIRVNAVNCPFLVSKLQIKVLPFVMCFIRGIVVERLIGFEQLGNNDDFPTSKLEKLLIKSGVLATKEQNNKNEKEDEENYKSSIRSTTKAYDSDDY